jgi:hypothetical protein
LLLLVHDPNPGRDDVVENEYFKKELVAMSTHDNVTKYAACTCLSGIAMDVFKVT